MKLFTLLVMSLLMLTGGCANHPRGIDVIDGTGRIPVELQSIQIMPTQMPGFLAPMVVSSFSAALAERGLEVVSEGADGVATLRLEQEELTEARVRDDFEESVEGGNRVRFMARIVVEIRRSSESPIIWQGSVQRLHTVGPGDYMHGAPGTAALLNAFRLMLGD